MRFVLKCYYKLLFIEENLISLNLFIVKTFRVKDIFTRMNKESACIMAVKINPKFIRENKSIKLKDSKNRLINLIGDFTEVNKFSKASALQDRYLN